MLKNNPTKQAAVTSAASIAYHLTHTRLWTVDKDGTEKMVFFANKLITKKMRKLHDEIVRRHRRECNHRHDARHIKVHDTFRDKFVCITREDWDRINKEMSEILSGKIAAARADLEARRGR